MFIPTDIDCVIEPAVSGTVASTLTAPYMHDGSILTLDEAVAAELYRRADGRGLAIWR